MLAYKFTCKWTPDQNVNDKEEAGHEKVAVKPDQKVFVAQDKGKLTIGASESGMLTYQVEFVPNHKGWFDFDPAPTQKDYDECTVAYTAEQGLQIHTVKGLNAVATVGVPAGLAINAKEDPAGAMAASAQSTDCGNGNSSLSVACPGK